MRPTVSGRVDERLTRAVQSVERCIQLSNYRIWGRDIKCGKHGAADIGPPPEFTHGTCNDLVRYGPSR